MSSDVGRQGTEQRKQLLELTHTFFQKWLAGNLPNSDQVWELGYQLNASPDFTLVATTGKVQSGRDLGRALRSLHGHEREGPRSLIWAEDYKEEHLEGGSWLAQYVEVHDKGGQRTRRQCSALLQWRPGVPCNHVWRWVHETWVEGHGPHVQQQQQQQHQEEEEEEEDAL